MSIDETDPRCPECDEPIGQTATYCMHCSADLSDEREAVEADELSWDGTDESSAAVSVAESAGSIADAAGIGTEDGQVLDPDGIVDNTLTAVVGILGGIIVGIVGTSVLIALTESGWALLFGFVAWLGATAYLVRRRTVQGAISKTGYAVAFVLLLVPVIALSPVMQVDGGLEGRGEFFGVLLLFVLIPALFAAGVGWVASKFVPDDLGGSEG
jgi:hypothetical protein